MKNLTLDGAPEHDDGGRSATGALISEPRARDIKINAFSLALQGKVLVEDTIIELNQGGRYGLLGRNGCGKSTLLKCLAAREIPIPPHFDVYLLDHEAGTMKYSRTKLTMIPFENGFPYIFLLQSYSSK